MIDAISSHSLGEYKFFTSRYPSLSKRAISTFDKPLGRLDGLSFKIASADICKSSGIELFSGSSLSLVGKKIVSCFASAHNSHCYTVFRQYGIQPIVGPKIGDIVFRLSPTRSVHRRKSAESQGFHDIINRLISSNSKLFCAIQSNTLNER